MAGTVLVDAGFVVALLSRRDSTTIGPSNSANGFHLRGKLAKPLCLRRSIFSASAAHQRLERFFAEAP